MIQYTKKLHQIWLQGKENLPKEYQKYSQKYRDLHSSNGWSYHLWDDKQIRDLINNYFPHISQTYDQYELWIMKVDLAKYAILAHEGGIIVDMDTDPKKSFEELLAYTQNKPTFIFQNHSTMFPYNLINSMRKTNNHFLYFPHPNHELARMLVNSSVCTRQRMPWDVRIYYVLGSIGPIYVLDIIKEYGEDKVNWIDSKVIETFFENKSHNSWNKHFYDSHDIFWGILLVVICFFAIICVQKSKN